MYYKLTKFIQDYYQTSSFIPIHAPSFNGNEKKYVIKTIESTFVSSVGQYVDQLEQQISDYTSSNAIATVNGTSALHAALHMANVRANDMVITQALTFVATCNAINYCGAKPVFIDVLANSILIPFKVPKEPTTILFNCSACFAKENIAPIIPLILSEND